MRKTVRYTVFSLAVAGLSHSLSIGAFAADQNTYRAGSAYLKTIAPSHQQCAVQCQGDAACRSWNFVRPNAGSVSGVCEFNNRSAIAIKSPNSMSGIMHTNVDPMMSRAIEGRTNTIRVGSPAAPQSRAIVQRRGQRIVKREPVSPQNRNIKPAMHTRPDAPRNIAPQRLQEQRPRRQQGPKPQEQQRKEPNPQQRATRQQKQQQRIRFKNQQQQNQKQAAERGKTPNNMAPNQKRLAAQQASLKKQDARPDTQPPLTPEQEYYRDQYLAHLEQKKESLKARGQQTMRPPQQRAPQMPMQQQRHAPMPQQKRPAPMPMQKTMQQQRPMPQQKPLQKPMMPNMQRPQMPNPQQQAALRQQQAMRQQQRLYGSLHDDLTQNMTPVSRPQTAPDDLSNQNAPLATSRARPNIPVQRAPLNRPAIAAGLAGG